jgi:hypothetical protein
MTELLRVMQIIDENSNVLPEGDYLEVCNLLKKSYDVRTDPVFLFDYEDFRIPSIEHVDTFRYFYDYYYDMGLRMDSDFIHGQIRYLEDELDTNQPLKRITKTIRATVMRHCCMMHGDMTSELTLEDMNITTTEFRTKCKTYIHVENDFRAKYRNSVIQKIMWLEESDGHLESL